MSCSDIETNLPKIKKSIRKAIQEDPHRKEHGYANYTTSETAFWIDETSCEIHKYKESPKSFSIMVHSHQTNDETLNEEDVKIWRDTIRQGKSTIDIVLFPESNETMDILAIDKKENNREKLTQFLSLTPQNLKKQLQVVNKGKGVDMKDYRVNLRKFADKYGLKYLENISY